MKSLQILICFSLLVGSLIESVSSVPIHFYNENGIVDSETSPIKSSNIKGDIPEQALTCVCNGFTCVCNLPSVCTCDGVTCFCEPHEDYYNDDEGEELGEKEAFCTSDVNCGHGKCVFDENSTITNATTNVSISTTEPPNRMGTCKCNSKYATFKKSKPCQYKRKSLLTLEVLTYFPVTGLIGAPWFYMCSGLSNTARKGGYGFMGFLHLVMGIPVACGFLAIMSVVGIICFMACVSTDNRGNTRQPTICKIFFLMGIVAIVLWFVLCGLVANNAFPDSNEIYPV